MRKFLLIGLMGIVLLPCFAQQPQVKIPKIEEGNAFLYETDDDGYYISHSTYPFGTQVMVTNLDSGRQLQMQVGGRIDQNADWLAAISATAAGPLGINPTRGYARVRIAEVPKVTQRKAMRATVRKFSQVGLAVARSDGDTMTAAHPSLSVGTKIKVTNTRTNQAVVATISARIRASQTRILELSRAAARSIGVSRSTEVRIESVE
ncbi:MAG: septal ring lytic transglycosylase RlpA family protein [Treponema sp.]|jgi:rare lipoprotein A (peptidoglycan hydrolase)|nr:septal ring lytic transglycosylase RlpA family protein [Treponema sp.]